MERAHRVELTRVWAIEMREARTHGASGNTLGVWRHLGRAHIVSQPLAGLHVRTHYRMLIQGAREHRGREVVGQLLRIIVAGPASLVGRYPVGNTGGADVPATRPMPVPDDLAAVLRMAGAPDQPSSVDQ